MTPTIGVRRLALKFCSSVILSRTLGPIEVFILRLESDEQRPGKGG